MFCTASFSSFLFLTLAWTRWLKHAVSFTLVLNWEAKDAKKRSQGLQIIHTYVSASETIGTNVAQTRTQTLPPGLGCYQAEVNRHIHQAPLIASHPPRAQRFGTHGNKILLYKNKVRQQHHLFLKGETSSFPHLGTHMHTLRPAYSKKSLLPFYTALCSRSNRWSLFSLLNERKLSDCPGVNREDRFKEL